MISPPVEAASQFLDPGRIDACVPLGRGHINDTYCLTLSTPEGPARYVLQSVNLSVFPRVAEQVENIVRIGSHLEGKPAREDRSRIPPLLKSKDGEYCHWDSEGQPWRLMPYIEQSITIETVHSDELARQAAYAYGRYIRDLADLPAEDLFVTMPGFHDTARRFADLLDAIERDPCRRQSQASDLIEYAMERAPLARFFAEGREQRGWYDRAVHQDTKINNILFRADRPVVKCVIDLDTSMPGLPLADFGDLVRTCISPTPEDQHHIRRPEPAPERFRALAEGYLAGCDGSLLDSEKEFMEPAGRVITFEVGIRFLTDFLEGDRYFKTGYASHNLDRCRSQFALLAYLEDQAHRHLDITEALL